MYTGSSSSSSGWTDEDGSEEDWLADTEEGSDEAELDCEDETGTEDEEALPEDGSDVTAEELWDWLEASLLDAPELSIRDTLSETDELVISDDSFPDSDEDELPPEVPSQPARARSRAKTSSRERVLFISGPPFCFD